MHNIWVATDLHLSNREDNKQHPFLTQRERQQMYDNYAAMIQPDDLLIFLGDLFDVGTIDPQEIGRFLHSIKGHIIMCRGNHDSEDDAFYKELGVDEICDILVIHNLIFSHKPVKVAPDELNIHGHLHTEKMSTLGYQHINAYAVNFNKNGEPVLLDDILDSAYVQNADIVKDAKMLNHIEEKFEKYTSLSSSDEYHSILDLSDEFSLAPIDESTTKKDRNLNLFFVSEHGDYDETIVRPKIPDNYMTQNGFEDNTTPRVCFSTSIDGCLIALGQNITNKVFYVYQPVGKHKVVVPTEKQVPDVKITKERWICEPVELTCIGKIKAIDENGPKDDGIPYRYGPNKEHEARLYAWGYQWLERFNESISPSLVSLSAKEDEYENSNPLDEILFPDVDSTQYWEADDDKANNKIDGLKYSDDRSTTKTIHKNDVVADGQATLDESSNKTPQILLKVSSMSGRDKYLSIIAKDLFDEHAKIVPEIFEQKKLESLNNVNELIAYFYKVTLPYSTVGLHGYQTENTILGAYLYRQAIESAGDLTKSDMKTFFGEELSDENIGTYIRQCINRLNEIELAVCGILIANLKLIRLSIDSVCCDMFDPNARKELIKRAKDYIDKNQDEFIKTEDDGTVSFCYNKFGVNRQVFISKEMYNNKAVKKNMRPSRFLARLGLYNYIIVAHGHTIDYENGKYRWNIEPITVDDEQFTDLDKLIRHLKKTNMDARILVMSCNEAHIIPDTTLYDHVDYADNEVLFESADLAIKTTGSANSMLKDIIDTIPKKIKQLNKLEAQLLSAIDNFDILVAPDKFEYVHIDDINKLSVELKTIDVDGKLLKYRKSFGKAIKNTIEYYSMLLMRVMMSAKRMYAGKNGHINEGVCTLSIAKRKFPFSDMVCESADSPYMHMPLFDGYNYQSIEECAQDVQLYQASGGLSEDIRFDGILTESSFDALAMAISDHSKNTIMTAGTSEVFFTREITPESLIKIFNLIYMPGDLPSGWKTMVKISTGEPGGHNYLKPELIGNLVKKIHGIICDTVTAYDGNRDTKEKQLKTMKDHGFTKIGEVDVLDGDGELVIPVKDGYMLQNVNAGKNIIDYDFHVILSHFKGHQMAGYGGAIKNVAIGCASRRGKSQIHTYGSTAEMTVGFLDQYDQQSFLKAMVDAAKSFIDVMKIKGPILYINIANNLSIDCDCNAHPADPTMEDIGIFASWDPVAVDSACIDAIYHAKDSHDLVERIESKDGTDILLYAEESGMGFRSYELINIDRVNENADGSLSLVETKEYNRTDNIGPMDRDEKKKIAEKYGLRAVGQESPSEEEDKRRTPEQRLEERNKQRLESLKKARKVKKQKAFVRKVKSHLPGVKNETIEMLYESDNAVDSSDDFTPDRVEHSPLYGDRKHFFYNYDIPKETNTSAEKLDESVKVNDITRIVALNNELNDYQYGLSRDNQKIKKQNTTSEDYDKYYRVATPAQFVKQNGGICWDFATYEAFVFKKQFPNIKFKTYYIVFDVDPHYPTHTFLVFEKDMKFYYFESSFKRIQGIWVANSISDIFNFVLYSMNQYRPKDCKASLLKYKYSIFEYNASHPDIPGSTTIEFMNLMEEIGQEIPHVYSSKYDVKPYIDTNDFTVRKTKTKNENDPVSSEAVKLDFYLNKEHIAEASISAVDTGKGFLYDLEVFKKYRGQGNGTKVMQYILANYKVSDLSVDADNVPAIKLYTKFGFKRKKSFYDKTQKKTFDWYQREPILLDESVHKSTIDSNHKQKGRMTLSSLDKIEVTEKWRKEHTAQYPWLKHIQSSDEQNDVSAWMKDGELVAVISVDRTPSKRNKIWIHNIHINDKYRGYGLSKQLLDYAISNYKANALAVKIDNKLAQKVYLDYGFSFGSGKDDTMGNSKIMYLNESSIQDSYHFEFLDKNVHFYDKIDEAATDNKKLYPVYIMLVHSGTTVSNVIKAVSHSEFSHASISFDSSMDQMYSFARKDPRNPFIGGFRFESIGKGFYDQKEIPYAVYMVPCTESQIKKMKKRLSFFEKSATKFKFDFTGLIKNYLGIVDNPEYRWFCSRFVADILNAGAPKNKPYVEEPSLQDPDDFKNDEYAHFVVSGSNLMKYDQKLVDKRTRQIIREIELEKKVKNESTVLDLIPMNPYESQVLSYQLANMDESAFDNFVNYLKSFKLKFDKNGNLIIRRREYDQLDQHFRASLKLIKAAEKAGDIGTVKDELCKIYYMINLIQTQYLTRKPTPKTEKVYRSMENLRSVMLNAFHQHFKYVTERDPKFNFTSYYETTKYGKDITIDSNVLSAVGKTIVTILS